MILEQYITLFNHFEKNINQDVSTSIEEISQTLFCTPRNSKTVLKKLVNLTWINWVSGVGRGNKSKLVFLRQPFDLIMGRAMELVRSGEIKTAKNFISNYSKAYPELSLKFNSWIETLFGYNVETKGNKKLDILRLKLDMSPIVERLDPIGTIMRSDRHILRQITDTLLHYNQAAKQVEPHIAFYWEYNDEKKSWRIYLNKGIKFHNGKELTSKDVVYTFNRFKSLSNNAYAWMLEDLESIKAIDDYVVELTLIRSNNLFLSFLCDDHLSILPYDNRNKMDEKYLIGTGPFKIVKNDEDILILEANDTYFKGRAFLDRVELWSAKDETNLSYEAGEMQYDLVPKQTAANNHNDFKHIGYMDKSTQYLTINLNKDTPFKNIYFREAFRGILNTSNMVKELGGERCEVAKGLILFNDSREALDYSHIKKLLEKSDYKGEILKLYTYDHGVDHMEDANWIKEKCEKFGILINVKFLSSEEMADPVIINEADIIHDSSTLNESLEIACLDILLSDTSFLKHHLSPSLKEEIQVKISQLYEKDKEAERIELLKSIEEEILKSNNVIPLYRSLLNLQSHNMIQNVLINIFGWIDFYHIWFKKKL